MFSKSLIFKGALHLCFAVSERVARYHFLISCYNYFEEVLSSDFYYYGSLADFAIDVSNCETYVLL